MVERLLIPATIAGVAAPNTAPLWITPKAAGLKQFCCVGSGTVPTIPPSEGWSAIARRQETNVP